MDYVQLVSFDTEREGGGRLNTVNFWKNKVLWDFRKTTYESAKIFRINSYVNNQHNLVASFLFKEKYSTVVM